MFFLCGSSALRAEVQPSRRVVVGLIGAGARGMELLQILMATRSVEIGAVCETYEPRMFGAGALSRSKGHRTRYYRQYRDLLSDPSIDAVVIATPDFWHSRMTIEAIEQRKDVYVEQPLTRTWQEGLAVIAAHGRSKQVVHVGSQRRSSRYFAEVAKHVRDEELAPVRRVEARASASYLLPHNLKRGPTKLPEPLNFEDWQSGAETHVTYSPDRFLNWRFYSAYGGGCITDLGAPLLDGIQMVAGLGYPLAVSARGQRAKAAGFDTAARAKVEIEYEGGVLISMWIEGASPHPQDFARIRGKRRQIDLNALASADATQAHVEEFLSSVQSRTKPSAPPEAVFPATLACQMANLSIASGRKAYWRLGEIQLEG
jgi:predicted dehydrogenase